MTERSTQKRTIAVLLAGFVLAGCGATPDNDTVLEMYERCQEVGGQWAESYDNILWGFDDYQFSCRPNEPSDE